MYVSADKEEKQEVNRAVPHSKRKDKCRIKSRHEYAKKRGGKKFCLFPELLWNMPEGLALAMRTVHKPVMALGWREADIVTKINTSDAA